MRLDDLEIFSVAAHTGNLHRAADALGLTQPTLSKALARLERELGTQLFERTPRGVFLTVGGKALLRRARQIGTAVSDLNNEIRDLRQAQSGVVRIGCLPVLIPSLVTPLLAEFFTNRPLATFALETQLSACLLAQLQQGETDLVLAAIPEKLPAGLSCDPVGRVCVQVVARDDHPRLSSLTSMAKLADERWALPAASLYLRQWIEQRFLAADLRPPRVAVESSNSPAMFADLLRCSELLSVMPPQILALPMGQGLVALSGVDMVWHYELGLFWREDGYMSPICQDFRTALREHSGR